jgi:hypothetical protein
MRHDKSKAIEKLCVRRVAAEGLKVSLRNEKRLLQEKWTEIVCCCKLPLEMLLKAIGQPLGMAERV